GILPVHHDLVLKICAVKVQGYIPGTAEKVELLNKAQTEVRGLFGIQSVDAPALVHQLDVPGRGKHPLVFRKDVRSPSSQAEGSPEACIFPGRITGVDPG